ncbi:RDD family protein [Streptomyces sp. ST2-7A]|uniref:RDD family protein n=1 Tax=Streptomyces sp. ST2-7A TaxID=2907214 RepID=UPI001F2C39A1|nr:RDD family protein [Streptomyces sp. ST2-7A]MCE7082546.1 RDD family protein [Streptomyces sp. ST2-7A]
MSNEQPPSGPEPERDPLRKQPPGSNPPGGAGPGGPGYGEPGYGPPPPPGPGHGPGFGAPGDAYAHNPYGGPGGARDPLEGMPPLAPLGRRFLARVVDWLVVAIPVGLITLPWAFDGGGGAFPGTGSFVSQLVYLLVYFVYEGLMLANRGQTLGKMLLGIRVSMLDNGSIPAGNPGWTRAAVYSLPQLVPCLGTLFWLWNVLSCTWDRPYRQCVHDKAARTVVVRAG